MTFRWTTHISPEKWIRVRRELEDNGFSLPFAKGKFCNKKTGYEVYSWYDRCLSRLEIRVTYPLDYVDDTLLSIEKMLDTLFESRGVVTVDECRL